MADAMLEIGVRVDASNLVAGMQLATQIVRTGTAQMAASFAQVNAAAQQMGAVMPATASTTGVLTQATQAAATSTQSASQAFRIFGQTLEQTSGSGRHLTESSRAISGAFMELEGRIPIRAMERFLGTSETLGPILMTAFPYVGAVALGAAVYHLGEEAYHAYQNIVNLKEGIQGLDQMEITVGKFVESQAEQTERHVEEILTKTAGRSAALQQKLVYDQAKGIDLTPYFYSKEVKSLPDDVKGNYESMYKNVAPADVPDRLRKITAEVGNLKEALDFNKQGLFGEAITKVGDFGAKSSRDPVAYMQARLTMAKQIQEELSAASDNRTSGLQATQTDQIAAQQQEQDKRQRQAEEASRKATEAQKRAAEAKFKGYEDERQKEIEAGKLGAAAELAFWQSKANAAGLGADQYRAVRTKIQTAEKELGRSKEEYSAETTRGAEIRAQENAALAQANVQYDLAAGRITKVTADQRIAAVQAEEYTTKIAALRTQLVALNADKSIAPEEKQVKGAGLQNNIAELEGQKAAAAIQEQARAEAAANEEKKRTTEAQARLNAEITKGTEISAANAASLNLAKLAAAEPAGVVSHLAAAQQEAAIHTQEHIDKLKALQKELNDLKAKAADMPAGSQEANQNAQAQASVQNRILQEQGAKQTQSTTDVAKIKEAIVRPYSEAFQQISSEFNQTVMSVLHGQETIGRGAQKLAIAEVGYAAQSGLQWVETKARNYLMDEIYHLTSQGRKNAVETTSRATSLGQAAATNSALVLSNAAVAGAGAVAATAAIPIIGPALAPEVGAATFAEALGYMTVASAAGGLDVVPRDNFLTNLHKNEMVLPAHLAGGIRSMINNNSRAGDTFNFGNNTISGRGKELPEMLDDHEDAVVDKIKSLRRDGRL